MGSILVSVIVPTYNRVSLLKNTLLSLKSQSYPRSKYQIIVVDDGSTDNTEEVIASLHIKNIEYILLPENSGASSARNSGLKVAKGDLIIFCDSDFIVPPNYIENHVNEHEKNNTLAVSGMGHWNYVVSFDYGDCWNSYQKKGLADFYKRPFIQERLGNNNQNLILEEEIIHRRLEPFIFRPRYLNRWVNMNEEIFNLFGPLLENYQYPWLSFFTGNASIKKDNILELGGFDENFSRIEDWEFAYRFYKNGGKFKFSSSTEAIQQLSPPTFINRKKINKNSYLLFTQKHPYFEIYLLSLGLRGMVSYKNLSLILEQHNDIKKIDKKYNLNIKLFEKMVYLYANNVNPHYKNKIKNLKNYNYIIKRKLELTKTENYQEWIKYFDKLLLLLQ